MRGRMRWTSAVSGKLAADGSLCLFAFAATHVRADLAGFMDITGVWQEVWRRD
jgi:hypothetical protein